MKNTDEKNNSESWCDFKWIIIFTLATSKCYGKVWVLFLRATTLVSARKSHSSGVRGLAVRCLLFNPNRSCSNPCVCANFFYKYSEAGSHFFRHYETSPFSALWDFFENFSNVPKGASLQIVWYFATTNVKNSKGSFFQIFRHYETWNFSFSFFFENF